MNTHLKIKPKPEKISHIKTFENSGTHIPFFTCISFSTHSTININYISHLKTSYPKLAFKSPLLCDSGQKTEGIERRFDWNWKRVKKKQLKFNSLELTMYVVMQHKVADCGYLKLVFYRNAVILNWLTTNIENRNPFKKPTKNIQHTAYTDDHQH